MLPLGLIGEYMKKLDGWALEGNTIVKDRQFGTFKGALEFVNKVGEIAEKNKHYPDIVINNKNVRIVLLSKEFGGVSSQDFEIAQEIDKISCEESKEV